MLAGLARNVLSSWAALLLNVVILFLLSPFIVRTLGDTMYGLWVLVNSLTGYMGLLDAGLRVSVVKYIASQKATGDTAAINRTVSSMVAMYAAIAGAILLITTVLSLLIDRIVDLSPEVVPTARLLVWIAGASLAVSVVSSVFNGVVAGAQRYDLANGTGIAVLLLRSALILLLLWMGYGVVALGLVHLGSQILGGLLLVWISRREIPTLRLSRKDVQMPVIRELYRFSLIVFANTLGIMLAFGSGPVITGIVSSAAAVTYFSIAAMFPRMLRSIISSLTQVLHPFASAQNAKGDSANVRGAVVIGTQLSLLVGLPIAAAAVVLGEPFIDRWMGPKYGDVAGPLLGILTAGYLVWLSQAAGLNVLMGVNKHRYSTLMMLLAGAAAVALSFMLGSAYGVAGVVWGSVLPLFVTHGVLVPLHTARVFQIPLSELLLQSYLRPIAAAALFAGALLLGKWWIAPQSYAALTVNALVALPVFLLAAAWICFSHEQRSAALQRIRRGRHGSNAQRG